jgi:DNA polymerase III subunit gamma/tau
MYRVLARKYRPQTFADLIGQEVLVRTLTNAFASGRIAHAFVLTGIRGIGKTTTARIIARGLNCIGPDGLGEPTTTPCGVCPNCIAIAEDRHVDVIEMDAASNTGVDNMRDLIDSVQYAPVSARYKVYIIDEVHMLSKSAFNAILKTLEEPPPHVKFIFATTEIRKIPVTIISRCQKFDLKRVEMDALSAHLINVAGKENIALPPECATLIAAAAEGSVRDSLSILDQAIAMHTDSTGAVNIATASVRDMLGLADKTQTFRLIGMIFKGKTDEALADAQRLHHQGADPAALLSDLLDITHYLTRIVVAPALLNNLNYSPAEQALASEMSKTLSVPALTRAWQILTKGADEMRHATHASATLEMILVRLGYASNLPTPSELVRSLQSPVASRQQSTNDATRSASPLAGEATRLHERSEFSRSGEGAVMHGSINIAAPSPNPLPQGERASLTTHDSRLTTHSTATALKIEPVILAEVHSFADAVKLFEERREPILATHLINDMRLVAFEQGRIEVKPISHMNADVPARINRRLAEWTGAKWNLIFNTNAEGETTLREQRNAIAKQARDYAFAHPKVQAVLEVFPDAKLVEFVPSKTP